MKFLRSLPKAIYFASQIVMLQIKVAVKKSPLPFIMWLRQLPDPALASPLEDSNLVGLVTIHKDLIYPSEFNSNSLDIYCPNGGEDRLPTILWIHGGSFVAGDKSGTTSWCRMMASNGYTVVSMNYEVAPEARYPSPVIQMTEVYNYLQTKASTYPTLDMERLIVGGDSAGAQIASQFLAIQTNPVLANLTGIHQVVPEYTLKAALLYCGPYNVKQLAKASSYVHKFFMDMLGWAYIGERNWSESDQVNHASTVDYVTENYPPVFISDGNHGSFENHAKELESKLLNLGVPVTSLFFPHPEGIVHHEYQFQLDTKEARKCFEMTLSFLTAIELKAENN